MIHVVSRLHRVDMLIYWTLVIGWRSFRLSLTDLTQLLALDQLACWYVRFTKLELIMNFQVNCNIFLAP